jgi:hypothetical protein
MKLRDVHNDWRIVAGVALLVLGAGNCYLGATRTQEYSEILARASTIRHSSDFRSFDELDATGGGAVLAPLTAEQRKVSYATARMDFYHATYLSGLVMASAGIVLAFIGFLSVIRRDARRMFGRLGAADARGSGV